jgi:hypothetical protein
MIANLRAEERAKKQAALLGTYNMPSAGGVAGQYLGSLGSGLTNAGFGQLGAGSGASTGSSNVAMQQSIMPKTI